MAEVMDPNIGLPNEGCALEGLEPKAKAYLIGFRPKLRGISHACNAHAANGDRVIDDVRKNRIFPG
jgi:hypothetical protein